MAPRVEIRRKRTPPVGFFGLKSIWHARRIARSASFVCRRNLKFTGGFGEFWWQELKAVKRDKVIRRRILINLFLHPSCPNSIWACSCPRNSIAPWNLFPSFSVFHLPRNIPVLRAHKPQHGQARIGGVHSRVPKLNLRTHLGAKFHFAGVACGENASSKLNSLRAECSRPGSEMAGARGRSPRRNCLRESTGSKPSPKHAAKARCCSLPSADKNTVL